MGAITNTDIWEDEKEAKRTEWKNRKKALAVHVESGKMQVAVEAISKLLKPTKCFYQANKVTRWTDKFLFTPPEYTVPKEERLNYKKLIN